MSLERIVVSSAPVRDEVVAQVRAAIGHGSFEPGQRLIERQLCELLGVSRGPVREALRQLEAEGLVQALPQRGVVVAPAAQAHELQEIFEARAALEGLSGRLFAQRASDEKVAELEAVVRKIEQAHKRGDLALMFRIKTRYYEVLKEGAGNSIVSRQLELLRLRLTLTRGKAVTDWTTEQANDSVAEVRRVLEAMRARDPKAAERACLAHAEGSRIRAFAVLEQDIAAGASRASKSPDLTAHTRPKRS